VTTVEAIETRYAGCRFRSRLEARWAVFFSRLRIPWRYEPEGYLLDGEPYLPDFLLYPDSPGQAWFEVKGKFPSRNEIAKAAKLAEGTGIRTYLYFGQPKLPGRGLTDRITTWDDYFRSPLLKADWNNRLGWIFNESPAPWWQIRRHPTAFRFDTVDDPGYIAQPKSGFWWWTDCPHCGLLILKLGGVIGWCPSLGELFPPDGSVRTDVPKGPRLGHETPRLLAAYRAARSARFEHGEKC
jgi:hypothetical protein